MSLQVVEVDTRDMRRGVAAMLRRTRSASSFFRAAKTLAREEVKGHQRRRRGPGGEPWPARRRRMRRPVLGKLPGGYKWQANSDGVVGEQRIPWASVHHTGGTVGRGSVLPARPFAGFRDVFQKKLAEGWLAYVSEAW